MSLNVVTVLSPPRSGSSALCRMLGALGLEFGPPDGLLEPSSFNPYGFYEYQPLVVLNDDLLRAAANTILAAGCLMD